MPDISLCLNLDCPSRSHCYRGTATPCEYSAVVHGLANRILKMLEFCDYKVYSNSQFYVYGGPTIHSYIVPIASDKKIRQDFLVEGDLAATAFNIHYNSIMDREVIFSERVGYSRSFSRKEVNKYLEWFKPLDVDVVCNLLRNNL